MPDQPIEVETVSCQGCGSSGPHPVVAAGPDYDNHACGDQEFSLAHCRRCSTFFLNPRPTAAMLPIIYGSESYYAYELSTTGNSIVLRARRKRDTAKVAQVLALLATPPAQLSVLDIGAGDGALLDAFHDAGVGRLAGLEIHEDAAARLSAKGFDGMYGRIETTTLPPESFDVVSMIQVIEHVAEPRDVIAKCRAALRPGGVLLLETPNMASWDRRFFRKRLWGGYHFPRHWTLWDIRSLPRLLEASGFTVRHVSTPAAAVQWAWSLNHVAQHLGAPPSLANLFGMQNPVILAALWGLEIVPSLLGRSANMRILARRA